MKTVLKSMVIALIAITSLIANATNRTYEVILFKDCLEITTHDNYDDDRFQKRVFDVPNPCRINNDGIDIPGLSDDILVYEIWDADGTVCIAYFTDEESFIESLFSMTGDYLLKFYFEDCVLYGEISL